MTGEIISGDVMSSRSDNFVSLAASVLVSLKSDGLTTYSVQFSLPLSVVGKFFTDGFFHFP